MRALALCAGFATRLHPVTLTRAKPLLPVLGRPVLTHLAEQMAETGLIERLLVVSNARFFEQFLAWANALGPACANLGVDVIDDGATSNENRLGAIRDLAFGAEHHRVPGEPLLVCAGDNLFRWNLSDLLEDYATSPRNLVVAHHEPDLERLRRTGVAELDAGGTIVRLTEKPSHPASDVSCTPVYVLESAALDLLPKFLATSQETDAPGHFMAWLCQHLPVHVHFLKGARLDLGSLDAWRNAEAWLDGQDPVGRRD